MAPIQQTQKKIQALMEEAQKGGNPDEIRPKVLKIREDLEGQAGGPAHGCPEKAVEGNAGQAGGPGCLIR
jgi:hypothetical protein